MNNIILLLALFTGCTNGQQTGILGYYASTSQVALGSIYSKSSFANLSDFESSGSGFTAASNVINVASDATSANYIRLPHATQLDQFTYALTYKLTAKGTGTGNGLQLVMESQNTTNAFTVKAFLVTETGNANYGKAALVYTFTSNSYYSSSAMPSINVNDVIRVTLSKNKAVVNCLCENVTQGTSVGISFVNNYTNGSPVVSTNTNKVTVRNNGTSTQSISSIVYSSTAPKGGIWGFGDSITEGSYAGSASNRWAEKLGASISAGGSDKTAEILLRTYEAINYIKPGKVYLMIGTNDILKSVPAATWQANYQSIVSQLESAGITVIKLASPPNNSADMSVVKNFLAATYPTTYIDTYTPLLGTGTGLNSSYDGGDGIHLNAAGNTVIVNKINQILP